MASIYERVNQLESDVRWLKEQLKDGLSEVTKQTVVNILQEGLEAEVKPDLDKLLAEELKGDEK